MAVVGFHAVVFLTTAVYASAIVALGFMTVPATSRSPAAARAGGRAMPAWTAELLVGVRLVKENRAAALLLGIYALCSLGEGTFSVLFVPFVTEVLRGGELAVGTLFSVQAVGGILGGAIFGRFGHRFSAASRPPAWEQARVRSAVL